MGVKTDKLDNSKVKKLLEEEKDIEYKINCCGGDKTQLITHLPEAIRLMKLRKEYSKEGLTRFSFKDRTQLVALKTMYFSFKRQIRSALKQQPNNGVPRKNGKYSQTKK